jgi:hypothetical protein
MPVLSKPREAMTPTIDSIRLNRLIRVLLTISVSCTGRPTPPGPASLGGNYRFVEHPPGVPDAIAGVVVIRGDTLIVVPESGVCDYEPHASQHDNVIVYTCGPVTLRFDRRDPVRSATFQATATLQAKQVICDSRQRGCSRARVESTAVARPLNGVLHLKRINDPP